MYLKFWVAIFLACVGIGCKKQNTSVTAPSIQVQLDSVTKSSLKIQEKAHVAQDWVELINLETEIKSLFDKPVQSYKDLELLKNNIEALKKNIPELYNTNAVTVRIKVIETETLMLEQKLMDGNKKEASKYLLGIFEAYNSLAQQVEAHIVKQEDYERYN